MANPLVMQVAVFAMAMLCAGGVAWVFLYPALSGEKKREKRLATVSAESPLDRRARADRRATAKSRQAKVAESLKEMENKSKGRSQDRPTMRMRLKQAGLSGDVRQFYVFSVIFGLFLAMITFLATWQPLIALGALIAGSFGVPQWFIGFRAKRRQQQFIEELPNAIDIIVRGVKSGLPLNDCLRIVAHEAQDPLRTEFREVVESQAIGVQTGEAIERVYQRVPLPEVNFFAITVTIQQSAGGNLAEALANTSRVLRERKKMRAKIKTMSQEAKSSAAIIGALPLVVMFMINLTEPEYISLLWTEPTGHVLLAGSAIWMLLGVLVMRKMINFDF